MKPKPLQKKITRSFESIFQGKPTLIVRAPGRINLIGEHTDYNNGFVLPMAIEQSLWIALRPRTDRQVSIHSLDLKERAAFSLDRITKEGDTWIEFIKGVAWVMQNNDMVLTGWEGVIASDIPVGAGLSSSAALEIASLRAFAEVSKLRWDGLYAAQLGQQAENDWIGVKCGIMDQMVSSLAQLGRAFFLDCQSLKYDHIFIAPSLTFIVLDTTTRRVLHESDYNERRKECERAANLLGVSTLRDATPDMLTQKRQALDEVSFRRARHVLQENKRVVEAVSGLMFGDGQLLGRLLNESHASLKDDFEVTNEALDEIVSLAREHKACFGARMTGAGFGGCAIALVGTRDVQPFIKFMSENYFQMNGQYPSILICSAGQGVGISSQRRLTP